MGTSATIAMSIDWPIKGYQGIYCHWDGYPSDMYPLLRDWYFTGARVEALVEFGDASSIDRLLVPSEDSGHCFDNPETGVCLFYHRDRGDEHRTRYYYNKDAVLKSNEFVYIFEGCKWTAYHNGEEVNVHDY